MIVYTVVMQSFGVGKHGKDQRENQVFGRGQGVPW